LVRPCLIDKRSPAAVSGPERELTVALKAEHAQQESDRIVGEPPEVRLGVSMFNDNHILTNDKWRQ
jgi:hypothetical protein